MNASKIYSELLAYIETMDETDRKFINSVVEKGETMEAIVPQLRISNLMIAARGEMRAEAAKAAGRAEPQKSATRMIKNVAREELRGAWDGADGKQYVCSGCHIVALNSPLELPKVSPYPSLEKTLADANTYTVPVELPTVAEIKTAIKMHNAEQRNIKPAMRQRPMIDLGDNLPMLDANYLLDLLELLPDAQAFQKPNSNPFITPVVLRSSAGLGLILPVRRPAKQRTA